MHFPQKPDSFFLIMIALDRTTYQRLAFVTLAVVMEQAEQLSTDWDVELQGEILTLISPDNKTYVLNLHNATRQLWYASPVSGAWHFAHENRHCWRSTRGPETLAEVLVRETGMQID
jgi:frataxin